MPIGLETNNKINKIIITPSASTHFTLISVRPSSIFSISTKAQSHYFFTFSMYPSSLDQLYFSFSHS